MKLGIVIFPTKEIQDVANSYRMRYDPHYALLSPHLTLKEAFEASESDLPAIVNELKKVSSQHSSFELTINKISHFYPTNNVIYFAVEDQPKLDELHQSLHQVDLLKHERKYSFVPHITIGQKMPDDELHDIYNRIKMADIQFTFKVDRFHLLYQLENETWSIHQSFSLGEDC